MPIKPVLPIVGADAETSRFAWSRIEEMTEREMLFLDSLTRVECRNAIDPSRSFTLEMTKQREDIRQIQCHHAESTTRSRFLVYRFPVPGTLHCGERDRLSP